MQALIPKTESYGVQEIDWQRKTKLIPDKDYEEKRSANTLGD